MKILIGCECSGIIREAFRRRGHDAWSCDIKPSDIPGPHIQDDLLKIINGGWDMMIAHPPCTYLTVTANKWLKDQPPRKSGALVGAERRQAQKEAISFFIALDQAPIKKKCLENPVGVISSVYRRPDQIIQPYYFGDEAQKTTCLWLTGLPKLVHIKQPDLFSDATHVNKGEIIISKSGNTMAKWYFYAGKANDQESRAAIRSRTFPGIAEAMADQWG